MHARDGKNIPFKRKHIKTIHVKLIAFHLFILNHTRVTSLNHANFGSYSYFKNGNEFKYICFSYKII